MSVSRLVEAVKVSSPPLLVGTAVKVALYSPPHLCSNGLGEALGHVGVQGQEEE